MNGANGMSDIEGEFARAAQLNGCVEVSMIGTKGKLDSC